MSKPSLRVEHAIQEIKDLIERVKSEDASIKEMLHLESLRDPYIHALGSVDHNLEHHSKKSEWSVAEGAMILSLAGINGGHDDEFIIAVLKKVLFTSRISSMVYEIMAPLPPADREEVLAGINIYHASFGEVIPEKGRLH